MMTSRWLRLEPTSKRGRPVLYVDFAVDIDVDADAEAGADVDVIIVVFASGGCFLVRLVEQSSPERGRKREKGWM